MAEITDKKNGGKNNQGPEAKGAKEVVKIETGPVDAAEPEVVQPEGFGPEEVARMLKVKAEIASGRYTDITDEHRKLLFVQWMIEHDLLKS